MNRWWWAALLAVPVITGCEMSVADSSDPCTVHRQRLQDLVDNYTERLPGIRLVDLAGHAAGDIEPHLGQAARRTGGDGGYWVGLSAADPSPPGIARALQADINARQAGPLDAMAGEFNVLTQCRQSVAKENRARGADGRLTQSVADNRLEVGRLKYETDLDIANKGAVAVDIWRARMNEAQDRLAEALRAQGANPAATPAIINARALIRREDDFIAAVRRGREDQTTFAH
jgi:hypothetical protein